jgi:mRNA interferase MazF
VNRGDVCWYTFKATDKRRPVLILTRNSAIAVLKSVTVTPITSSIRTIPTKVILTKDNGLPNTCAANFDNIQTVPKSNIGDLIARLTARKMKRRQPWHSRSGSMLNESVVFGCACKGSFLFCHAEKEMARAYKPDPRGRDKTAPRPRLLVYPG